MGKPSHPKALPREPLLWAFLPGGKGIVGEGSQECGSLRWVLSGRGSGAAKL